jgi:hypothetical protein
MTLDDARELILSFPEAVEEVERRDGPIFRVRRAFFTRPTRSGGRLLLTSVPYEERELLVELAPETYQTDPNHSFLLVSIASVLPGSLKRLLEFRWRAIASKRAQKAYDAGA